MFRKGWQVPGFQIPVERVVAGMDGSIWLQRGAFLEPEAVWSILDRRGEVVGSVRTPAGFKLMRAGREHVWGVRSGEFGEPYVLRLRIVRADDAP